MKCKMALACVAMLMAGGWATTAQAQSSGWWKKHSNQTQRAATGTTQQAVADTAQHTGTQASQPAAAVAPSPDTTHTANAHAPYAGHADAASPSDAPAYSYLEAGYNRVEVDVGNADGHAGGGYVRGSVAIAEQVHLFGSYGRISRDALVTDGRLDVAIDQMEVGIGFHHRFAPRADFVTELALLRLGGEVQYRDVDPSFDISGDDHLFAGKLTLGVRAKPSPRTELWLKGGYVKLEDSWLLDDSFVGVVGGKIDLSRRWA